MAAAALAAIATRYFASLSESALPEALGLARAARLVAWGLVLAALGTLSAAFAQETAARLVHFAILGLVASISWSLLRVRPRAERAAPEFPLGSPILSALGSRANPIGSLLDSAERQLGIDLRSTWALSVVRRSVEPLLAGLLVLGWLSTSLTVVHLGEQGLVERLGVPIGGPPLEPGLHGHWPWPVDRVFRLPVRRIQALPIGHEGVEPSSGPEDVLWARQHAENEYTLLLGNGRDLITIDAVVQFRVRDARAWQYRVRNPTDALRAVAYRAVMRATVNRTLDEALSENVSLLTGRMLAAVQRDADDLGLGVEVVAFTVGGMHPPVTVAAEYQSVSSAELGKVTAEVNAETYRNRTVPAAQAEVVQRLDTAQADAAQLRARAAGEAWSFRTLESQFRADPGEFAFRRRLETLEQGLTNRRLIVLDTRIPRDGGELWLTP
ncbi:MAG TPA: protease modulator HflK [Thermoanaerobaculia bacterium]|nr:protease modulator HflK [Thermoanaerobaculia bacterium]